jgi:hypothetical protein
MVRKPIAILFLPFMIQYFKLVNIHSAKIRGF